MNNNIEILKKAYEYMNDVTPLKGDCGILCGAKCCKGDTDDGMILFPGEEKLFSDSDEFTVYYEQRYDCFAVRCNGHCDRNLRPLACRIFPYFIYLKDDDSKVSVLPDIRAMDFCPLTKNKYNIYKKFLRALRICGMKLCQEKEMREFLIKMTGIISDFKI